MWRVCVFTKYANTNTSSTYFYFLLLSLDWVEFVNTNICGVDWGRLAQTDYFTAAIENTKKTAYVVTLFIKGLITAGMSPTNITIAGHSLGAHIAGFIGKNLNSNSLTIARIYGLDPAGPLFTLPFLNFPTHRLSYDDARYVQVIHTASGTYGAQVSLGLADFYANAAVLQPGCIFSLFIQSESASPCK